MMLAMWLAMGLQTAPLRRTPASPKVVQVGAAIPDVIDITVQSGKVIPSRFSPYVKAEGDGIQTRQVGNYKGYALTRKGQDIAWLIGPKQGTMVTYEKIDGDPLDRAGADRADTFRISSKDDPAFSTAKTPLAVYRKSKANDWAQPGGRPSGDHGLAIEHHLYLRLPSPLKVGKTYTVDYGELNVDALRSTFTFQPSRMVSESVHVNQIGYRPDDPVKRGFLSVWMGSGGGTTFPSGLAFHVIDAKTEKPVFTGRVELNLGLDQKEILVRQENFSKTAVYRLDFSALRQPGRYRLVVDGVGCSLPFDVAPDVWEKAWKVQMRGLYHNRSGIALGPPYTSFVKPRDFHPADGAPVFQSTYSILEQGKNEWEVALHGTKTPVPQAWGGYHDAGDWNPRRITHMRVTGAQLEIAELFPQKFMKLDLHIPKEKGIPDVLTEAMFEVDLFRRLQNPDGGVSYGIETESDPIDGEVSWMQSMPAYVFKADPWSSTIYAQMAGRLAKLLAPYNAKLSQTYRDTGLKAMARAETQYAQQKANGTYAKLRWEAKDDRNLAAMVLYDLTGDQKWWTVFLDGTCLTADKPNLFAYGDHVQTDAAFELARTKRTVDPEMRKKAILGICERADVSLNYGNGNAFNITATDSYRPMFLGYYSTPGATEIVRAHWLTKNPKYLAGALQACQFQSGANPSNITYTTGLGANPVKHPLHLDSRRTGQPAPEGLTVFGNFDYFGNPDAQWATWPLAWDVGQTTYPAPSQWPIHEAFWDVCMYPAIDEFTVDIWAPNIYVWGYLAAR